METALPEMIHCVSSPTVLDRQRATIAKWHQEQGTVLQQQTPSFYVHGDVGSGSSSPSFSLASDSFMGLGEVINQCNMIDPNPGADNYWAHLGKFELPGVGNVSSSGYEVSCGSISRTVSCPPTVAVPPTAAAAARKDSSKKRKLERVQSTKCGEDDMKDKKIKGGSDETESKITEQNNNINGNKDTRNRSNNNNDTSVITSKENSKASDVPKPDYIHVRARRGQATDSHSLAERVRREKISERMNFLQDLVPGCNKITGKAGMLDEIINYVQSLQRQVEFLSMKLATVNPRLDLDLDIDSIFSKEMIHACTSGFPAIDMTQMTSELTNPTYLHFDPVQQVVSCSGLNMGLQRTTSAPVNLPEPSIDSSCFTQMQPMATWDMDFENLFNMEFQQGRATTATTTTYQPHHQYIGSMLEPTNMKMEN